jgi:hypothetical protein
MFRFTIRDVLLLTAIVALAVGWWVDHRHCNHRRQLTLAHAERLRDALVKARRAYFIARDNYYLVMEEQGSTYHPLPQGPDWSIADEPIPN